MWDVRRLWQLGLRLGWKRPSLGNGKVGVVPNIPGGVAGGGRGGSRGGVLGETAPLQHESQLEQFKTECRRLHVIDVSSRQVVHGTPAHDAPQVAAAGDIVVKANRSHGWSIIEGGLYLPKGCCEGRPVFIFISVDEIRPFFVVKSWSSQKRSFCPRDHHGYWSSTLTGLTKLVTVP